MSRAPDIKLADPNEIIADLRGQLAERTAERDEALLRLTATTEVLGIINASPGDLAPVFDAMLERALRLCDAAFGALGRWQGERFEFVATRGSPGLDFLAANALSPPRSRAAYARVAQSDGFVQFADISASSFYASGDPMVRAVVDIGGARTTLTVPLANGDQVVGLLILHRKEVRPFSDRQIALVRNFAVQAVIAMENARLITETREALDQQTATAEVLGVINSSPGDLTPVFNAILDKAHRLCDATRGTLFLFDGETFRAAAMHGYPAPAEGTPPRAINVSEDPRLAALLGGERHIHVPDLTKIDDPIARAVAERGGVRTNLLLPLRRDGALLGVISCNRHEVRPFSDKDIALLENFAAQAVIAMENARLITETREALDQQTATAEVLQVINSSPGDLAPVFDTMLEKALHLCEATCGHFRTFDGELLQLVAARGVPEAYAEFLHTPVRPHPGNPLGRMLQGERVIVNLDVADEEPYRTGDPLRRAFVDLGGARSAVQVALIKDNKLLGTLTVYRQEIRPFSDKQIRLLQNFAAQAVIAMENARLITETREALEQQTAMAEVLQVINSSPGDLAPVFDAMLEKVTRLCEASFGIANTYDGDRFRTAALHGVPEPLAELWLSAAPPPPANSPLARIASGEDVVHIEDFATSPGYLAGEPRPRAMVELGGAHSYVAVALRKDGKLLGTLAAYRQEVHPFTDKQIALLQNFAAQAVIAIENARLITETREALEQQTATAEVLQVINASPGDLAPVFDAVLDRALRLCEAAFGILLIFDGDTLQTVAFRNVPEALAQYMSQPLLPDPGTTLGRVVRERRTVHTKDNAESEPYRSRAPLAVAAVELGHSRTVLHVPLIRDETVLGVVIIFRQEVRSFTDEQIALLQNFAAQAVIAMENARLITETREALEQQTATAEVLQVINSSPGDLTPVFDAILEKAHSLCEVALGELELCEDGKFHAVALRGVSGPLADLLRQPFSPPPDTPIARLLAGEPIVQIDDLSELAQQRPDDPRAQAGVQYGLRTVLFVPLRKGEALLGYITAYRKELRSFSEKEIALLQNFATQAIIAMENARLITETREALAQQTATAEVLQVINSSPGDLAPVFDAMLEKAMRLCGANFGVMNTYDGEHFHRAADHGVPAAYAKFRRDRGPTVYGSGTTPARLVAGESFVHTIDLMAAEPYEQGDPARRALVDLGGARSHLTAALRRGDILLGDISIYRQDVHPFTEKQIALLQNFAAQAVIAIENARLLDEVRQRQAQLRVTFDNMADGVVMFDEDLRLAAWNRNFQELLNLPDAVLAERPSYADYLRLLAERGEFGTEDIEAELNRRLENTDQEFRTERTRPDGRVIEVRRNAVPNGGFVLIYSDITERKRSEEEIRAARDAAEAAYADLKAAQANLIQAEKMASLGQLTAGIAHEIKNPLNFVNNFASLSVELLDELKEVTEPAVAALGTDKRAEIDETLSMLSGNLEKIAEHGKRADNIVKSMLEHSRGVSGERREVDLNNLIEEALNLAYHGARAHDQSFNITLEREYARGLRPIELAPQEITRVFLNLFGNGFYAANRRARANGDGSFRPVLAVATCEAEYGVEVRVRDNGTGIPPEIRDKLFQPFFTTKPTGEGTGLGLSISYDIVTQQHGGTITVESEPGSYTEFTVRLPRQ